MHISLKVAAVSLLALSMAACGGKKDINDEVADCVFPDDGTTAAPGWICDQPVSGVDVSAVGSAEKTGAGHDFQKQMAATSARVQLAQNMRIHIQNMIKQYAETTGAADSETVDKVNTSVTKQITDETLIGSRIYKSRVSPSGSLYVLVGLDPESSEAIAKQALATSMKNERAQWQQFRAEKGFDELSNEIAAQQAR